ncbi:peroxiredoxin family protein [Geojedonia litorea]|uniref:Peroxiredoxin family protein n=1 Tax=Geojedonia litorea TaxID=1268269 RepID=A0ABV9N056_9FLAO
MRKILGILLIIVSFSCKKAPEYVLKTGDWRAELQVSEQETLPFNFEVTSPNSLKIFNASEVIFVDEVFYSNDSVRINMPAFEGYISAKINDNTLQGGFIKESLDRVVPFTATFGVTQRFDVKDEATANVAGRWEMVFSKDVVDDEYIALGIFEQEGSKVTGTIRTTTGDYRYLDGVMDGNTMKLSAFDGAHAFLFTAKVSDSSLVGTFYSGNHFNEPFEALRNENYELPDANTLTFLKEGYDTLEFSFPNTSGELISLSDIRFKNKVVIVQIMGSWCPNCLDESKFYSEYYNNNKDKNVEFIALAFEYAKTKEKAFKSLERLKDEIGITYPIVLAQYGTSDKAKAQEKLPMLNHILSYPTTIYIDKKGKARKIHTGFNGPATGDKYVEFKNEFETFVNLLLSE